MKYLILGAGPAGLSFANALLQKNKDADFLVLEEEEEAGGLCRSKRVNCSWVDTGGGHFLDVKRPDVNRFLFRFMPEEEWNQFDRDSRILIQGQEVGHPFEANIWQLNTEEQVQYLLSIAHAGCVLGTERPESFVDWIYWKLGEKIADDYMLPYNRKMFGDALNDLGTYWLEKLPDVSFEETLRSCLERRPYGMQPGHARFYYPKEYGYGELWKRLAKALGERLLCGRRVSGIDFNNRTVTTAEGESFTAETIVTTIPWSSVQSFQGMPDALRDSIRDLRHTSVVIDYKEAPMETKAHWVYDPDPEKDYHRILVRHNFSEGNPGYWTETRGERFRKKPDGVTSFLNEYAYPLNTIKKPRIMRELLSWCRERGVYGLGRWGEHEHYNSDVSVEKAMRLAEETEHGL